MKKPIRIAILSLMLLLIAHPSSARFCSNDPVNKSDPLGLDSPTMPETLVIDPETGVGTVSGQNIRGLYKNYNVPADQMYHGIPPSEEMLRARDALVARGMLVSGAAAAAVAVVSLGGPQADAWALSRIMAMRGTVGALLRWVLVGGAASETRRGGKDLQVVAAALEERLLAERRLVEELVAKEIKVSPANIVEIEKIGEKIVFLERGSSSAGLLHIIERHSADFARRGIVEAQIPDAIMSALRAGRVVGTQNGRPVYEVLFNGIVQRIAITVSNNGYVVGANPSTL
ncbi:MAG: hypothetical protein WCN95_05785 [bacterium]